MASNAAPKMFLLSLAFCSVIHFLADEFFRFLPCVIGLRRLSLVSMRSECQRPNRELIISTKYSYWEAQSSYDQAKRRAEKQVQSTISWSAFHDFSRWIYENADLFSLDVTMSRLTGNGIRARPGRGTQIGPRPGLGAREATLSQCNVRKFIP